ncbi:hypothetical protein A6B38_02415 [Bartonella bacilliformis]|uniref:Uncharacterized protein n=2 Tax=Bartonella bacilliformis TaxID=774 RepID=A1US13_BARBK|nr:hypothetical protein BARBAKC583_0449 [Bartonella bacilliformis KC583]AMG85603.1 hypothetical protein AL467_02190 [Bartonella bacilliformis]EKS45015.1 hypothetical protein BbINS_02084 [Bartonella bacilliformis INS]KZM37876.1 hypothetical protein AWH67_02590 [Bartonella bacilliformis]KZN21926.1 hypothetical protein A6B38_02415 [Bartonella bacilliformis]
MNCRNESEQVKKNCKVFTNLCAAETGLWGRGVYIFLKLSKSRNKIVDILYLNKAEILAFKARNSRLIIGALSSFTGLFSRKGLWLCAIGSKY